jgi:predicted O-methyltransferase YrrM
MDFIHPSANQYVDQYSNATPLYLREMYDATMSTHPHAHLQSNWNQGGFLAFVSKLIQPSQIIEIGTFTGFSSLCLAEGLTTEGQLHTIELREQDAQKAKHYFDASHRGHQMHQYIGDAKQIIPNLSMQFDLAFIDADKTGYIEYYELLLPKMQSKGLIIADNTLFHGEVLETNPSGKSAKAIQAFNEHIAKDTRTEKLMLTIRDGLTLIRKK